MSDGFNLRRHFTSATFVLVVLLVIAGLVGIFIYAGVYNIGADAPHSKLVYGTLEEFRERSISAHARDIRVPADLGDAERIAAGAGLYNEMCTSCHLGPGIEKSELSQGLYPAAPELAQPNDHSAAEQFWIIKHGVKMSAMPAWGKTHDDKLIWDMVAFIGKLPKLSPAQYQAAVAAAPASHEEMMGRMPGKAGPGHEHATGSKPHTHNHAHGDVHGH